MTCQVGVAGYSLAQKFLYQLIVLLNDWRNSSTGFGCPISQVTSPSATMRTR